MSCPRIFVSSTYYDLKHVREIIREFIKDLGYEPVLSEFSDIFYQPGDTVQNSCLREISSCDIFVLIVGKRYGSFFPGDTLSITHREYIEAQHQSIPIYSFIDLDVLHDYEFYKKNPNSDKCNYRIVKDIDLHDLYQITDVQVSILSYSSFEAVVLGVPIVLVNPDNRLKLFDYFDSEIALSANTADELSAHLKRCLTDEYIEEFRTKRKKYLESRLDYLDGRSGKRVVEKVEEIIGKK